MKTFTITCHNQNCQKVFECTVRDHHHIIRLHCGSRDCRLWFRRLSASEKIKYYKQLEEFKRTNAPTVKRIKNVVRRKADYKSFILKGNRIYRKDGIFLGEIEREDSDYFWARKSVTDMLVSYDRRVVETPQ